MAFQTKEIKSKSNETKRKEMAATNESSGDDMKHCYENLILIDVGANLTNKKYSRDLDAVVQRAQDSGQSSQSKHTFMLCEMFTTPSRNPSMFITSKRITQ